MKAQSANQVAVAVVAGLMAMMASGPAQAAGKADLEWATARRLNPQTLAKGLRSDYSKPCLLVASNPCQWESAMAALAANGSLEAGAQAAPDVDWRQQSVVVVAMGRVPYGYDLQVNEARRAAGDLLLEVNVDYQSYENQLDDVSPVHMLVVDAKGLSTVSARYSLDVPGLCGSAKAPNCGDGRTLVRGTVTLDDGAPVQSSMTWGGLKSMYR